MIVQERIRMSLLLEKMRKRPETANELGLKDVSRITKGKTSKDQVKVQMGGGETDELTSYCE